MKQVYRIEIPSQNIEIQATFTFWIGESLELVPTKAQAVPCTEDESLQVMERIGCVATCFREVR